MSSVIESPIGVIRHTPACARCPPSPPLDDPAPPSWKSPESAWVDESKAASTPESWPPDDVPELLPPDELLDPSAEELLPPPEPPLEPLPELPLPELLPVLPDPLLDAVPELLLDVAPELPLDALLGLPLDPLPDVAPELLLDAAPELLLDAAPELPLDALLGLPLDPLADVAPELLLDVLPWDPELPPDALPDPVPPSVSAAVPGVDEHPASSHAAARDRRTTREANFMVRDLDEMGPLAWSDAIHSDACRSQNGSPEWRDGGTGRHHAVPAAAGGFKAGSRRYASPRERMSRRLLS